MGALDGQVAIVTGGGSGIGKHAALLLSREGATVVLAGRRREPLEETAREIAAAKGHAVARPTDVADERQARELVRWTEAEFDRVDVLVNNAGANSRARSIRRFHVAAWDRVFAVNLTAPMVLSQAVLPGMLARGGGTIISVSSFAALTASPMAGSAYGASKAAILNLMRNINAELRDRGIRACTVIPGEAATDILDGRPLPPDAEARSTMMGPEDVAAAIVFCATLPPRTVVEEIYLRPTRLRDTTADVAAALEQ